MNITTQQILNAYEAYPGDWDVDAFESAWDGFLRGDDTPCPAVEWGVHQVTAGSCDNCGRKNYA